MISDSWIGEVGGGGGVTERQQNEREGQAAGEEKKRRGEKGSRTQVGVGFVCNARAANAATSPSSPPLPPSCIQFCVSTYTAFGSARLGGDCGGSGGSGGGVSAARVN